jgi:hypothetical protein
MRVSFDLDVDVPEERAFLDEFIQRIGRMDRRDMSECSEFSLKEFVQHIVGTTSGKLAVVAAHSYGPGPNHEFTLNDLAMATGISKPTADSWMRQLGRPEKKFKRRVFEGRWDDSIGANRYHLTPEIHAAIRESVS